MKRKILFLTACFFLLTGAAVTFAGTYDLVLLHGLTNKHQWSDTFLDKCLARYGSGNVYVIYTNESTRVWNRYINGRKLICCGENDFSAGDDSVDYQSQLMTTKTNLLKASYGLSSKIKIIAHSMGGLVSRRYVYANPGTVAGIVTLGTPHKGSPLAYEGDFIDFFLGADAAVNNLKPNWVTGTFNPTYPAPGPMATGGRLYTIAGDGDGWDCWGWAGELQIGWDLLFTVHWTDSDGAVPSSSPTISGGTEISKFWSYDHYELVREGSVATKALDYLPAY